MTNEITTARARSLSRDNVLPNLDPQLRVEVLLARLGQVNMINFTTAIPHPSFLARNSRELQRVREQVAAGPDTNLLVHLVENAKDALEADPDPKVTAIAVALLFDSRARQPANPVTYLSILCSDLVRLGFQPAVIAAACQRLRETTAFIPEICEVIEACRKVQLQYRATARMAALVLETRMEAVAAIKEAESLPPPQSKSRDCGGW